MTGRASAGARILRLQQRPSTFVARYPMPNADGTTLTAQNRHIFIDPRYRSIAFCVSNCSVKEDQHDGAIVFRPSGVGAPVAIALYRYPGFGFRAGPSGSSRTRDGGDARRGVRRDQYSNGTLRSCRTRTFRKPTGARAFRASCWRCSIPGASGFTRWDRLKRARTRPISTPISLHSRTSWSRATSRG